MPAMDSLTRFERASRADERPKYAEARACVWHRAPDTSVCAEHLEQMRQTNPRERLQLESSTAGYRSDTREVGFSCLPPPIKRITADTRILAISQSDCALNILTAFPRRLGRLRSPGTAGNTTFASAIGPDLAGIIALFDTSCVSQLSIPDQ